MSGFGIFSGGSSDSVIVFYTRYHGNEEQSYDKLKSIGVPGTVLSDLGRRALRNKSGTARSKKYAVTAKVRNP